MALYIISLVQKNVSVSSIRQFVASVSWMHNLGGHDNPIDTSVVQNILQSANRQVAKPVFHKKPITKETLFTLRNSFPIEHSDWNLCQLRDFLYILMSFTAFLRYHEASQIRRDDLCLNIDYFKLNIPKSKTDQSRAGQTVFITRSSSELCALTWLVRYLKQANIPNGEKKYIFRAIFHSDKHNLWGLRTSNKTLSHSYLSEMFKKRITQAGIEGSGLTLHSLRAGGVTLAANTGVPERLYKAHGRWKSDAVECYIQDPIDAKLSVTKHMDV